MIGPEPDKDAFGAFEQCLRDMLAHLYDPAYRPPDALWAVFGCDPRQGVEPLQAGLIEAIEGLRPASDVPAHARSKRIHDLLACRYVQGLTQDETAEQLGITSRHVRREQREAVHVLARRLWERGRAAPVETRDLTREPGMQPSTAEPPDTRTLEYHAQVRQELASLRQSAPGAVADVGEAMRGAVELGTALTERHAVSLTMEHAQPGLTAAMHPSALRQILITVIGELVKHVSPGQIGLRAERDGGSVTITITGHPARTHGPSDVSLVREILAAQRGSIEVDAHGDRLSFRMVLPAAREITVLVADDNLDLVHFYRRYTTGTRYRILHAAEGARVPEIIAASFPDIIVLDVMLPDVDGWQLLVQLREHPVARSIPVIVCSVVREEELAMALGATLYLPKPVRRRQFIQALDRVLPQARAEPSRAAANSAAPG